MMEGSRVEELITESPFGQSSLQVGLTMVERVIAEARLKPNEQTHGVAVNGKVYVLKF